jgi:hypothetical protein
MANRFSPNPSLRMPHRPAPPVYHPAATRAAQAKPSAMQAPPVYRPQVLAGIAPAVYRPASIAKAAQPKQSWSGPPVYRPQQAAAAQRKIGQPSAAPPVYRPQAAITGAPPVYRPQQVRSAQPKAAPSSTIQRYIEFMHPTDGRLQVSENMLFMKRADSDTDLWARESEILQAAGQMRESIVTVIDGEEKTFLNERFKKVLVRQRQSCKITAPKQAPRGKSPVQSSSSSTVAEAPDPFGILLKFLEDSRGVTLGKLIQDLYIKVDYPNRDDYFYGAFSAIRVQLALKINAVMERAVRKDAEAPIDELRGFLLSWNARTNMASSSGHQFNFLPTECGGFSKMVMQDEETLQENASVGNRMKILGLGELPGPWQNHYAAVIMQDGGDWVTLESAAGMDKWWFGMYGSKNIGQTFATKTLITKLSIGVQHGEPGSQACLDYAQSVVYGDDANHINQLAAQLTAKQKRDIDAVLALAGTTVDTVRDRKDAAAVARIAYAAGGGF